MIKKLLNYFLGHKIVCEECEGEGHHFSIEKDWHTCLKCNGKGEYRN